MRKIKYKKGRKLQPYNLEYTGIHKKTDSEIQKRIQDKKGSQRSIFKAYAYIHRGIDRKETAAILSAVH